MAAEGDDLRYFYGEKIGRTIAVTGAAGAAVLSEQLEKGRYMLRIVGFDSATGIWVRQGNADVEAAAAAPSMLFVAPTDLGFLNLPMVYFMVRGQSPAPTASPLAAASASADDFISIFQVAGTTADIQITKINRHKA